MSKGGKKPPSIKAEMQPKSSKGKVSKANGRQSKKNAGAYKVQFYRTHKNKIRKLKRTLKAQPNNEEVRNALKSWESDPMRGIPAGAVVRSKV